MYLEDKGRNVNTIKSYRQNLLKLFNYLDNKTDVQKITYSDLKEYKKYFINHYKPSTINTNLTIIKGFFRWLKNKNLIEQNIAEGLNLLPVKRQTPRWLNKKEQAKLIYELHRVGSKRDTALVASMLYGGLRVSEVCNLKNEDIKMFEDGGKIIINSKLSREIPFDYNLKEIFLNYIQSIQRTKKPGKWFFSTIRSEKISIRAVQHIVAKYSKKAGLKNLSPQILRNTFCHELIKDNSISLEVAAILMGHATKESRPNLQTTIRYLETPVKELYTTVYYETK